VVRERPALRHTTLDSHGITARDLLVVRRLIYG
jgi:hypothetical protein